MKSLKKRIEDPNLQLIYDELEEILGNNSYILTNAIRQLVFIENEPGFTTLAIDHNGNLYINKEFWSKFLLDKSNRQVVLLHELYHNITGDVIIGKRLFESKNKEEDPELELKKLAYNIAMDCRINASIFQTAPIHEPGKLFKELYNDKLIDENPILSLLTPYGIDKIPTDELKEAYKTIYQKSKYKIVSFHDLFDLVLNYLRQNTPKEDIGQRLLGSHDQELLDKLSKELKDALKEKGYEISEEEVKKEIINAVQNNAAKKNYKAAGYSEDITEVILQEAIGVDQKFHLNYFKTMSFDNIMHNVRMEMDNVSNIKCKTILIPPTMSRGDIFKLMQKYIPLTWDTFTFQPVKTNRKIPIYLDVSGSMHPELPAIVKLLLNIKDDIDYVWGFSNKVVKHTMEDLAKGKLDTTGGTDFDCIIKHALENNFSNLLVITDGYASCNADPATTIPEIKTITTVLCTSQRCNNNYFCNAYNTVVQIEDVTVEHV